MNRVFVLWFLLIAGLSLENAQAQQTGKTDGKEETPLRTVDQMPEFPGGKAALMSFLSTSIQYPEEAEKALVGGQVLAEFVVDTAGYPQNFTILKGLGYGCDEEVIRVLKTMPRWRPGIQNGRKVKVYYTLPVTFQAPEIDSTETGEAVLESEEDLPAPPAAMTDSMVRSQLGVLPEYPGGDEALKRFLAKKIRYPKRAFKKGITGVVVSRFVVDSKGNVKDIEIVKGIDPDCDKEVIRVLKKMPQWKPGYKNGRPVSVYYNMPVTFKINR